MAQMLGQPEHGAAGRVAVTYNSPENPRGSARGAPCGRGRDRGVGGPGAGRAGPGVSPARRGPRPVGGPCGAGRRIRGTP